MDKENMELQMKQQVETVMSTLIKLLVQFDLELAINKRSGDFIFEKNGTSLTATVGRQAMGKLYTQYQQSIKEEI